MRAEHSWGSVRVKCNEVWTSVRCLNNAGHSGAHVPGWHLQWLTALSICFMLISPCLRLAYLAEGPGLPDQFDSLHIILYWERGSVIFENLTRWIRSVTIPVLPSIQWMELMYYLCLFGSPSPHYVMIIYFEFFFSSWFERWHLSPASHLDTKKHIL